MRIPSPLITVCFWISLLAAGLFMLFHLDCPHHSDQRFESGAVASLILFFIILSIKLTLSQRSLFHAKKNLDEAQQLAGIGSWERDLRSGKGYWSENHYRLFDLTPRKIAPSLDEFFMLIHQDDRDKARATVIAAVEQGNSYEIMFRRANDDENRIFRSRGKVHCTEDGIPRRIVGSIQDITEKYNQQCLREQLLKQKELFITRLSHDLKTPLTPLVALLPMIRAAAPDEKQRNLIDICLGSAKHIMELVNKTTRLSQLSSVSPLQTKRSAIPLAPAVDGYLSDMCCQPKTCTVENNIKPELIVLANVQELEEIFQNLISNAIKFSPSDCRITVEAFKQEQQVTVCVRDNGIGLSSTDLTDVFDEFFKADQSRHELDSSGLGLSICRQIVENHGGRIWAESSGAGMGTAICFTLPSGGVI